MSSEKHCQVHKDHEGCSLWGELLCHLPYGVFSVALGLGILSFIQFFSPNLQAAVKSSDIMFHCFHFLHIIFAATGSIIAFSRFSKNLVLSFVVSTISTLVFCTLSDIILPYLGSRILGVDVHLHLCYQSELHNVIPFLVIGLINGLILSRHNSSTKGIYSVFIHFGHIFVSSLASLFYLFSHGFTAWHSQIGFLFVLLIIAVVIPCTFSDVIIPVTFARMDKKDETYPA